MATLFLIKNVTNCKYDTYREVVVQANTYEEAIIIHPDGVSTWDNEAQTWGDKHTDDTWAKPQNLVLSCIGTAAGSVKDNVIMSSFKNG